MYVLYYASMLRHWHLAWILVRFEHPCLGVGCHTVIHPVGNHSWEDINWDGEGHRTCINTELGTFCRLLFPGMVNVKGQ
jgi:hypothetical protein